MGGMPGGMPGGSMSTGDFQITGISTSAAYTTFRKEQRRSRMEKELLLRTKAQTKS